MFSKFISEYANPDKKIYNYSMDLIKHIQHSINNDQPLYAVHGFCTDGGTAGAMIKHAIPESAIIPIDYQILKDSYWKSLLISLNWVGIVDLEPFNDKKIDWYVDHHLSTVGRPINADRIRFDVNGDSGAWQLYLSSFLGVLPGKLIELAVMTRTTDTAGYISEPPLQLIDKLTDLDLTVTKGEEGRIQNEKRIWLLDDAWGSVTNLKQQLSLHSKFANDGFIALENELDRINKLREFRRSGIDIANELPINTDVVIFTFNSDSMDRFGITRRLQARGVKIVISLSKNPNGYKISFRRNRNLSPKENNAIQLNIIAAKLNGGGHAGASGGFSETYEHAINLIVEWANSLNLSLSENRLN